MYPEQFENDIVALQRHGLRQIAIAACGRYTKLHNPENVPYRAALVEQVRGLVVRLDAAPTGEAGEGGGDGNA